MAGKMNKPLTVTLTTSFLLHGAVLLGVLGVNNFFNPPEQLLELNEIEFIEITPPQPKAVEAEKSQGMLGRLFHKSMQRRFLPALSAPLIGKDAFTKITGPSAAPKDTVRLVSHSATNVKDVIPPGWLQNEGSKISVKMKPGKGINLNQTGRLSLGEEHASLLGNSRLLSNAHGGVGSGLIMRSGASAESLLKEIQKSKGAGLAAGGGSGKGGFKDAYAISGEIQSRKILRVEMPVYPAWAEEQGIEAEVTLQVRVEPDGSVVATSIYVLKTSGYAELDRLAKEALSRWFFGPLDKKKKQRDQTGEVRFTFRLKRG